MGWCIVVLVLVLVPVVVVVLVVALLWCAGAVLFPLVESLLLMLFLLLLLLLWRELEPLLCAVALLLDVVASVRLCTGCTLRTDECVCITCFEANALCNL